MQSIKHIDEYIILNKELGPREIKYPSIVFSVLVFLSNFCISSMSILFL